MHNSNYCYKGNLRFSCNLWYPQWFHMVCIQATHSNVIIIQVGKRPLFFFFLHARSAIPIVYGWNYKQRVYKPCHIPLKAPKIATSWEHFLLMFFCLPLVLWLNLCDMLSRKTPRHIYSQLCLMKSSLEAQGLVLKEVCQTSLFNLVCFVWMIESWKLTDTSISPQ